MPSLEARWQTHCHCKTSNPNPLKMATKIPKRCPGLEEKQHFSLFNFHVQLVGGWVWRWVIINPLSSAGRLCSTCLAWEMSSALHPCQEKEDLGNATALPAPGAPCAPTQPLESAASTRNKGLREAPDLGLVVISAPFFPLFFFFFYLPNISACLTLSF